MIAVIDTSYLIEFLDNPSQESFQWILDAKLIAPVLLKYEYNNVLINKLKNNTAAIEQFRDVIADLEIKYIEAIDHEKDIFMLAVDHKLSFYDATYLFLAVKNNAPIATFDGEIIKAAKNINHPMVTK